MAEFGFGPPETDTFFFYAEPPGLPINVPTLLTITATNFEAAMSAHVTFEFLDSNNTVQETHDLGVTGPNSNMNQWSFPCPPNNTKARCTISTSGTGVLINSWQWFVYLYCSSNTVFQTQPCCPPDPNLQITLNNILGLEQQIWQIVNTLQTGGLPRLPLYKDSTVHAGLSGAGTITLQTLAVAFRVDVTSDISGWPHNVQVPTYYFSMGFVTSYALTSPIKGWRLVYQTQNFPLAAECDQIGYTLPPGITVNITELLEVPGQ